MWPFRKAVAQQPVLLNSTLKTLSQPAEAADSSFSARVRYRVEGTDVSCIEDIDLFPLFCQEHDLALLAASVAAYQDIVQRLVVHFVRVSGPYTAAVRACTDMDLFCPKCGHQYGPDHLFGLSGARTKFLDARFTPRQQCPRCSLQHALYFFDNWKPERIEPTDLAALEAFTRFKTGEFFDSRPKSKTNCQLCGESVTRQTAFFVVSSHGVGKLECAKCYSTLAQGEELLCELRKDVNCVGRGVLRNARNYMHGTYERRLVRVG